MLGRIDSQVQQVRADIAATLAAEDGASLDGLNPALHRLMQKASVKSAWWPA